MVSCGFFADDDDSMFVCFLRKKKISCVLCVCVVECVVLFLWFGV